MLVSLWKSLARLAQIEHGGFCSEVATKLGLDYETKPKIVEQTLMRLLGYEYTMEHVY